MVVHTLIPSLWEAEAGDLREFEDSKCQDYMKAVSKFKKEKKKSNLKNEVFAARWKGVLVRL